jgi:dTDP-4-dehydrorhamnose 3,5-epimerase
VRFEQTRLAGAVVIHPDRHPDERGSFTRTFCEDEFASAGLPIRYPQANLSCNTRAGTLRGMHLNVAGHWEAKVVRCVRGAIHDVIVDLRVDSPTHGQWIGVDLTADNAVALFVPEGFAHGFLALEDDSDIYYHMSRSYEPDVAIGFRWDDPVFSIEWPRAPSLMSERDRTYPDYDPSIVAGAGADR